VGNSRETVEMGIGGGHVAKKRDCLGREEMGGALTRLYNGVPQRKKKKIDREKD